MRLSTCRIRGAAVLIAALSSFPVAHAQLGDLIKQKDVSGMSGGLGNAAGLGGALSGQSLTSGSLGNVAGLLEFCIKNNYLGGNKAASVKDSLMRKLPGVDVYWMATKGRSDWLFPMERTTFLKISIMDWVGVHYRSLTGFEELYVQKDFKKAWQRWTYRLGFYFVLFALAFLLTNDVAFASGVAGLWLVAKYTGLVWLNRLRNISEHFGSTETDTRNVVAGFVEAFFFIPHDSGLHALHHQFPNRPLADLDEAEDTIHNRGFFAPSGVIRSVVRER